MRSLLVAFLLLTTLGVIACGTDDAVELGVDLGVDLPISRFDAGGCASAACGPGTHCCPGGCGGPWYCAEGSFGACPESSCDLGSQD